MQGKVEIAGVNTAKLKVLKSSETMELLRRSKAGSNVLRYELADGTVILVRPSGTEPKIKVYIMTKGTDSADAAANIEKYGKWVAGLKS